MNIFSNVGITELVVILLLALLVVGPERLPELARGLAKTLREVRQAYENLTRDLGPELMSLQQTTREIRESVDSVRSIPKDTVNSLIKSADLEDTVKDLKDVEKSIRKAGESVTEARQMVQKPLDETLKSARAVAQPSASHPSEAAASSGTETASGEEPVSPADAAGGEQEEQNPAAGSGQESEAEADG